MLMSKSIKVGDRVRLIGIPDWLVHDLPEDEKKEIYSYLGRTAMITDIDQHGYYWLGFGGTVDVGDTGFYSGHSFCVSDEYLNVAL